MPHKVTLERQTLRFAAAHFTASPSGCEPLHGHNYDVLVEIHGTLTPDSWVIDFGRAKEIVRGLCIRVDHKFLLPSLSTALQITRDSGHVEIKYGSQRYVVPEADVAALEIDNSTAERLAQWFAASITDALRGEGVGNITMVTVGIEEMPGQAGWYSQEF
jgi:6-pyruvoyltetrahydropterin/6-carboxytetrahydropterin synthase